MYMETISRKRDRKFFIDNILVQIHFNLEMIRWTGLAPWEFEFSFPGSLPSTLLKNKTKGNTGLLQPCRFQSAPPSCVGESRR